MVSMYGGRQVAAARASSLNAEGHTEEASETLRLYKEKAFAMAIRDGEALSTLLEAQRCVRRIIKSRTRLHTRC